jgi:hypothetical protein
VFSSSIANPTSDTNCNEFAGCLFTMELYCTPKVNTLQLHTSGNSLSTSKLPVRVSGLDWTIDRNLSVETLFVTLLYGTLLFSLLSGHSCFHCYAIGLLRYYGTVTTLHCQLLQQRWHYWVKGTSHMHHHQGNPICHSIVKMTIFLDIIHRLS